MEFVKKKETDYLEIITPLYIVCEHSKMAASSVCATTGNPSGDAGTVMYYNVKVVCF